MDRSFMPDEPDICRPAKSQKKPARPVEVWYRATRGGWFRDWCRMGRYATMEIAEKVVRLAEHKNDFFEYHIGAKPHIAPQDAIEDRRT